MRRVLAYDNFQVTVPAKFFVTVDSGTASALVQIKQGLTIKAQGYTNGSGDWQILSQAACWGVHSDTHSNTYSVPSKDNHLVSVAVYAPTGSLTKDVQSPEPFV